MLKSRLLGAVGIVAVVGGIAGVPAAQTPEGPKFEVASVRVAPQGMGNVSPFGQNRWTTGCVRLSVLVGIAFDVTHQEGLPSWNNSECYAVAAKAEDGVLLTREALRPRMQQLLVERFKLVAHIETQPVSGYALVLAKGGPKMKPGKDGPPLMTAVRPDSVHAPSIDMDTFAMVLARAVLNQPVVNETGLAGTYAFAMTFAPEGSTDSALPSIFTALEEQLGLKLEGGRKLPVDTVVIDHVEHPTEN